MTMSLKLRIILIVATLLVLNGEWLIEHRATLLLIGAILLAARNGWIKTNRLRAVLIVATLLFVGGSQMISAQKKVESIYPTVINTGTWAPSFNSHTPLPNNYYQDDYGDDYGDDYENDFGDYYEDDYGGFDDYCEGDCYDMDNDGRTWNDVDADGDGLYESP